MTLKEEMLTELKETVQRQKRQIAAQRFIIAGLLLLAAMMLNA